VPIFLRQLEKHFWGLIAFSEHPGVIDQGVALLSVTNGRRENACQRNYYHGPGHCALPQHVLTLIFARDPTVIMIVDFRIQWVNFLCGQVTHVRHAMQLIGIEIERANSPSVSMSARLIDLCDHFRQWHAPGMRDFLQAVPEGIFEATLVLCPSITMERLTLEDFMTPSSVLSARLGTRSVHHWWLAWAP
jgi:hypothetical protein